MFQPTSPESLLLFTPFVPRRVTASGWSAEVQRCFVAGLARTGVVSAAARSVGRTPRSAWQLRQRAGADSQFVQAWDIALDMGRGAALDRVIARGFGPVREPVWYRGRQVGWRERHDNRLLFAALRAMDGAETARVPPTPAPRRASRLKQ